MEKMKKREIKRVRHILDEIVSLAEDEDLRGGILNAVKRYNAVIRHLEGSDALPAGLFQPLSEEGAVNFPQIAVESRMLSGYLEEVGDEDEDSRGKPDFSPVIALAPFLDQSDLKTLIQAHLSGRGFAEPEPPNNETPQGAPDLRALAGLAPHLTQQALAEMVEACLARDPVADPNLIVALAPHMDRDDLSRLLRQYAPAWFGAKSPDAPGYHAPPPSTDLTAVSRQDPYA